MSGPGGGVTVLGCARCGEDHPDLVFREMARPITDAWRWWAPCPTTGDPIILTMEAPPGGSPPLDEREEWADRIGERLRTQDNRITANPIFAVQQRRRIWGIDAGYTEHFVWVDPQDHERTSEHPQEGCRRVGYIDVWEFVTPCLTEAGCEEYIAANGHNLTDPRIYVYGGFRNREWGALREYFKGRGGQP